MHVLLLSPFGIVHYLRIQALLRSLYFAPFVNSITEQLEAFSELEDLGNRVYYVKLLNQLAIYNLDQRRYDVAINYILDYLQVGFTLDLDKEFISTIVVFENLRKIATTDQIVKYQTILQGGYDEKSISSYIYSDDIS